MNNPNQHQNNQWSVAAEVLRQMAESNYFGREIDANLREHLFKNLARWSEVNFLLYGEYDLRDEQIEGILDGIDADSFSSLTAMEGEVPVSIVAVADNGNMVYELSAVAAN